MLVSVPCLVSPPGARQIDAAMPDFRGARGERCVSPVTLRTKRIHADRHSGGAARPLTVTRPGTNGTAWRSGGAVSFGLIEHYPRVIRGFCDLHTTGYFLGYVGTANGGTAGHLPSASTLSCRTTVCTAGSPLTICQLVDALDEAIRLRDKVLLPKVRWRGVGRLPCLDIRLLRKRV